MKLSKKINRLAKKLRIKAITNPEHHKLVINNFYLIIFNHTLINVSINNNV